MKRRDTLTALGFLAALALALAVVVSSCFGGEGALETLLKQALRDRDVQAVLDGAERAVNQDLDRDHFFIQLFGGVQRLCGRRVVEDAVGENTVVKLSTGALNFVDLTGPDPAPQAAENAGATAALAQDLSERGIPYRFLLAPQKIGRDQALLPTGVTDRGNAAADAFLAGLAEAGAAYTDLRPLFEENGSYADWFFRTDHHWKPEAAFFAWQYLAGELDVRYGIETPSILTDPNNWQTTVLEDFFLGSQGKRVGSLYAGVDDFTIYTPKFDTNLTYVNSDGSFNRSGPFEQSVCFPERVAEKDWFNGNPYTYYSGGDYGMATMINHNNPDGPKVVLLRESFSCTMAPFLSLSCSELTTIDLRHFTGDLMETMEELEPDLVLTLYTASTAGLDNMFEFSKTE